MAPATVDLLHELNGLRLLVVEGMDNAREATRLILERNGADVLVAKDGPRPGDGRDRRARRGALRFADAAHGRYEFIRALHERPGITAPPVIAISGLASREDHRRTERAGFEGRLDKPFDDAGLLAAFGAVIGRRR